MHIKNVRMVENVIEMLRREQEEEEVNVEEKERGEKKIHSTSLYKTLK